MSCPVKEEQKTNSKRPREESRWGRGERGGKGGGERSQYEEEQGRQEGKKMRRLVRSNHHAVCVGGHRERESRMVEVQHQRPPNSSFFTYCHFLMEPFRYYSAPYWTAVEALCLGSVKN